jgi:hypothetical protein
MISIIKKILKPRPQEKKQVGLDSLMGDGIKTHIKETKQVDKQDFIGDFDIMKLPKREPLKENRDYIIPSVEQKPMRMTKQNKDLLKRSIVISLDFPVSRPDLEFIAKSRIDGRPIYRYIGEMPFKMDIPFEELMSLEGFHVPSDANRNQRSYPRNTYSTSFHSLLE